MAESKRRLTESAIRRWVDEPMLHQAWRYMLIPAEPIHSPKRRFRGVVNAPIRPPSPFSPVEGSPDVE